MHADCSNKYRLRYEHAFCQDRHWDSRLPTVLLCNNLFMAHHYKSVCFGNCPPTQGVCWQLVIVYSLIFLSICSGTELLRSTEGTFYTPNWPLTYPSSTTCSWTFYPPEGKTVLLFFMSFEMEGKFECKASRPSVTGDEIRVNGG